MSNNCFESRLNAILSMCPTLGEQEALLRRALNRLEMQKRLEAIALSPRRPQDDEGFECEDQS